MHREKNWKIPQQITIISGDTSSEDFNFIEYLNCFLHMLLLQSFYCAT